MMSHMPRTASVIVRTCDSAGKVDLLLDDLETQTIRPEIVVVDSGSVDDTRERVAGRCDVLVALDRASYRPGWALNSGAAAASGEVHFAVSSHCRLPRSDFVERSLALYDDGDRVAGTNGYDRMPGGGPTVGVYHQTRDDVRRHPRWGFSNHASSWRADVWRDLRFSEELPTAEDKEWALRVLDAGWTLAYVEELLVDRSHMWKSGLKVFYQRSRRETAAMGSYLDLPSFGPRDLVHEWWHPSDPRASLLRLRLSPKRMLGLVGTSLGTRDARTARAQDTGRD
jgi:glycosyltransferase involved in cell wall biosynthesis